ncbi:hypothetical protein DA70_08750 [Pandoraea pnomenusa]|nr:hypothetical protein DA70_08750 [Pandoraea pnomenusa]
MPSNVGGLQIIVVDHGYVTDTCSGQVLNYGTTERTCAEDEYARPLARRHLRILVPSDSPIRVDAFHEQR